MISMVLAITFTSLFSQEVDFIVPLQGRLIPIEVKSGKNYTLSSLSKVMGLYAENITSPIVLHAADYRQERGITYLPLYMTPLL